MTRIELLTGDCLNILKSLEDSSVDSLVTDPPAGISFMGKAWDDDKGGRKQWVAWMSEVMQECLRILKPGTHGLVWAIPRTSHWTATALEDAGFEVRDVVTHIFGSGFPKSHNIGKAIGDERFKGIGTALKPASEHWILVRKPCSEKTVAANVLQHGTGGLNIDASRVSGDYKNQGGGSFATGKFANSNRSNTDKDGLEYIQGQKTTQGRFPANLLLSHNPDCIEVGTETVSAFECTPGCAVAMLDKQSIAGGMHSAGASRFFYCAKASRKDKNAGLEGMPVKSMEIGDERPSGSSWERRGRKSSEPRQNHHPTVKSTTLMAYLIMLITPPNGIVLDPFMGSGSTGVAAKRDGFDFIGIEQNEDYVEIANRRMDSLNFVPSLPKVNKQVSFFLNIDDEKTKKR